VDMNKVGSFEPGYPRGIHLRFPETVVYSRIAPERRRAPLIADRACG
jgi:hypothetical protein